MDESGNWRHMAQAPRDGTRIVVTVRPTEQGPAAIDQVFWAAADRHGIEGWRSLDSAPGCIIAYAEPELKGWMPLPGAAPGGAAVPMPAPYEGDDLEFDGSGI